MTKIETLYKCILKIPYVKISFNELFTRVSLNNILSADENLELSKIIHRLNPEMIFFKRPNRLSNRLVWFDTRYKYSTVISNKNINTQNLDCQQIYRCIYKTPIIFNYKSYEIANNVIFKDNEFVITDEEIFCSEFFQKHTERDPILSFFKEISQYFNFDINMIKVLGIDSDVCLFLYKKQLIVKFVDQIDERIFFMINRYNSCKIIDGYFICDEHLILWLCNSNKYWDGEYTFKRIYKAMLLS